MGCSAVVPNVVFARAEELLEATYTSWKATCGEAEAAGTSACGTELASTTLPTAPKFGGKVMFKVAEGAAVDAEGAAFAALGALRLTTTLKALSVLTGITVAFRHDLPVGATL